jgi:hypothetical protein
VAAYFIRHFRFEFRTSRQHTTNRLRMQFSDPVSIARHERAVRPNPNWPDPEESVGTIQMNAMNLVHALQNHQLIAWGNSLDLQNSAGSETMSHGHSSN